VPFGAYIKDYPNADMASKVTIHHLLTHTGGTGDIFGPWFIAYRNELHDTEDYESPRLHRRLGQLSTGSEV
jgi:D-alanyl-D-alanine carboxypeptidase